MKALRVERGTIVTCLLCLLFAASFNAQPSEFTYQGRLTDGVLPANGAYQMEFSLFGSLAGPDQIGSTITVSGVTVTQGVFTVTLNIDAPNAFDGGPRWLAIAVKRSADPDYTRLNPRQPLTSTPYAIKSQNASTADLAEDSTKLGGRDASEFVVTTLGPSPPQSGNFNVSGTGTLGNLSVGSGSAGAPAVTFSGDGDTGMFRSAADTLDFSTGGVSRIQIGPDGRVGIGTAPTAAARLSVFDGGATPGVGTGGSFAGGSIGISGFGNGATSTASSFGVLGTAEGSAGSRFGVGGFTNSETGVVLGIGVMGISNGPATFNYGVYGSASGGTTNWAGYFDGNTFTGGTGIIRARINSDLNAGIGLTLNDQPGWSMATVTGGQFQIFNDFLGQNAVWIQRANNNVGIGTTSPGAKLDVLGDVNTSTQYNIGGNRVLSTPGLGNFFGGFQAGDSNTSGGSNTFLGASAGRMNAVGNTNTYVGVAAGELTNTTGNSFFGASAGRESSGGNNSFFGNGSGRASTGSNNAFFGYQSGMTNASGQFNAFFGSGAGNANTTGGFNSFFGAIAGSANVGGTLNSFFGTEAGDSNINGHSNSFFGRKAGDSNTSGSVNVFIGISAGQSNTTGHYNTIVGGDTNVTVSDLQYASAIGARARVGTSDTIVLGKVAGTYDGETRPADTVQIPGDLTVVGAISGTVLNATNAVNATNATTAENVSGIVPIANGGTGSPTKNFVDLSTNQIILGNKTFNQTASFTGANIGSLTSSSSATFNGSVAFNNADPISVGGTMNVGGSVNAEQLSATEANISGPLSGNVVNSQTHFSVGGIPVLQATEENLLLGRGVTAGPGLIRATAIGNGAHVGQSDSIVLGTTPGFFLPVPNTRVGIGVQSPTTKLDIGGQVLIRSNIANPPIGGGLRGLLNVVQTGSGDANFYMQGAFGGRGINFAANVLTAGSDARLIISHYDGTTYQNRFTLSPAGDIGIGTITPTAKLDVEGTVRVGVIGVSGITAVCFDASLILSACSSSGKYKNNIGRFTSGLDLIKRLRPVSFNWNVNNQEDMGLVAEEVAKVEPLLVTRNAKGEVEGVKYDRISVVLINVVKEQQEQIDKQQKEIENLKKIVCELKPSAGICKEEK